MCRLQKPDCNIRKKGMTTHFHAIHPLTQEVIPIWVGNYV